MLVSTRNFILVFANAIVLTTVMITSSAVQNVAYRQSFLSVPNIGNINTANNNKEVILNFDDGYESQHI